MNDRWLVFAKLGGGWVHSSAIVNLPESCRVGSGSSTNGGWLIGGGIEYGFKAHWTVNLNTTISHCQTGIRPRSRRWD